MSVNITFYKSIAEKRRIDKTNYLTLILDTEGELKENTSILNPVFNIRVAAPSTGVYDFNNCNYCYIAEFERYYFITDITVLAHGLYRIACHVDVLMSNKEKLFDISNPIPCVVDSSEQNINTYFPNGNIGIMPGQYQYRLIDITTGTFHRSIMMSVIANDN